MIRICLDYGHGGVDPGAIYKGRKESMDNLVLGMKVAERLRRFGVVVDEIRTTDASKSLNERCIFANNGKYDYFISFHRNAYKPEEGLGAETYVHINGSPRAMLLTKEIQKALVACGFRNRGVKRADFQVLRRTKMPAVLIEIGFIDNSKDNAIFDSKREEIIYELAGAIILGTKE
jgi:N-acetylmuramoyl-L-alanine amidase